ATVMKSLALSDAQIRTLPNPLRGTVATGEYRSVYNWKDRLDPFLPSHLDNPKAPWVCLSGRPDQLPGEAHSKSARWRSTFLLYGRIPGDRNDVLKFYRKMNQFEPKVIAGENGLILNPKTPQLPVGAQFALVERAMLINDRGVPTLSPLILNIQLRAYIQPGDPRKRSIAEFVLVPHKLFKGGSALRAIGRKERHFKTFASNDPFETDRPFDPNLGLATCMSCHSPAGIHSVNSRSRIFPEGSPRPLRLEETTPETVGHATAFRKTQDYTWGVLEVLWRN
ncbi:MAG: hypothetical protein AAF517_04490, partial [Planctomycetota bacterium]